MITEVLKQRNFRVEPDGKGFRVIVPPNKSFNAAVDEICALIEKHECQKTKFTIEREVRW